ncbi:hypothetical protein [Lysobacter gummosus]
MSLRFTGCLRRRGVAGTGSQRCGMRWLRSVAGKLLHDCDGFRGRCSPG